MHYCIVWLFISAILRDSNPKPPTGELDCISKTSTEDHVIWPKMQHDTCSVSTPGCTNADGILQIGCCNDGSLVHENCTGDTSNSDPRCPDNMRSTVGIGNDMKSLSLCYEVVNPTSYPFECRSKTGLMLQLDLDILTQIGGRDNSIWLPIVRNENHFRFITRNDFYMEPYSSVEEIDSNDDCTILINNTIRSASCQDNYLGICLEFPYVIHKFSVAKLNDLLNTVSDVCNNTYSDIDFCKMYKKKYPMNIVYFSSRKYLDGNYLFLQKSNLRVALQIRNQGMPSSGENINLFVALSDSDWNTFLNTSFDFKQPILPKTREIAHSAPKITLSADDKTFQITENNPDEIKWINKDYDSQFIYCFTYASPEYEINIIEVKATSKYEYPSTEKFCLLWCDAFDFDLNIIRSNIFKSGNMYSYISDFLVTFSNLIMLSNEAEKLVRDMFDDAIKNEKGLSIIESLEENDGEKLMIHPITLEVKVRAYWFLDTPAKDTEAVDKEFSRIKNIIGNMSSRTYSEISKITMNFILHFDYCMEDFTFDGNSSYKWATTPKYEKAQSSPICYFKKGEVFELAERKCSGGITSAAHWSVNDFICIAIDIKVILSSMLKSAELSSDDTLLTMNELVENYFGEFDAIDINLVAELLARMTSQLPAPHLGLLSSFLNNLQLIERDVLQQAQENYNATDSILYYSNILILSTETDKNFINKFYLSIPINFSEHSGVILKTSKDPYNVAMMTSDMPPNDVIEEDDFESAIFFNYNVSNNSLKTSSAFIVLSLFTDDYLFCDKDSSIRSTTTIVKVLAPEGQDNFSPMAVFLMTKGKNKGRTCACWKNRKEEELFLQGKWGQTVKFELESFSMCIFKSSSYCTLLSSDPHETKNGYVSNFTVTASELISSPSNPPYLMYQAFSDVLDAASSPSKLLTYELSSMNFIHPNQKKVELVVHWIVDQPAEAIPDIEKEYIGLRDWVNLIPSFSLNEKINTINVRYFRHEKYCIRDHVSPFFWPTTSLGESAISIPCCYNSNGTKVSRKCVGDFDEGAYWESESCSSTTNITKYLDDLLNNFNHSDPNVVLSDLNNITKVSAENFYSYDISLLAEIFTLLSSNMTNRTLLDMKTFASVVSNIQMVNGSILKTSQEEYNATDKILYSVDKTVLATEILQYQTEQFYVVNISDTSNCRGIVLQLSDGIYNVTMLTGIIDYNELSRYENFQAAVILPDILEKNERVNTSIIISIYFKNLLFNDAISNHNVSIIFGILIPEVCEFIGNIELIYKNNPNKNEGCAYWKYGLDQGTPIYGRWENESESQERMVFSTCYFNHTTHFAMLIDDVGGDSDFLEIITNIGCFLSVIGLLGILITGLIFERWRRNLGNVILMNFVFTVVIQIGLYYFSAAIHDLIRSNDSCIIVGALLHYSVISEFCWMLIIAVLQFKRFVEVLTGPPKYILLKSFLCGWIVPSVPVLLLLAIDPSNYITGVSGLCYPSKEGLYLGVLLPTSIIILINLIIFSYIIYNIFHRKTECVDTVTNEVILQWRLAVLLFFMLGLTWSFALIGEFILTELFLYLFCITATLQGFIMFLFFIVFNDGTRLLYLTLFKKLLKKYYV